MRLLSVIGVACIFAGVTFIFNDLIAHWWGESAGVGGSEATVSIPGLVLTIIGIVTTIAAEKARATAKTRAAAENEPPRKSEKVVLYEHGPDQPY